MILEKKMRQGKYYNNSSSDYEKRLKNVIEGYSTAIIQKSYKGLSEEMSLFLDEFIGSSEQKAFYYEVARMIYCRYPLFWVRWIVGRRLKSMLTGTVLEDVMRIILEHLINEATSAVIRRARD